MPTLIQLEYLLAVEQEGHFGRAAYSCGVSQPSLSNAIKNLERELGAILFDRAKTPVIPTEQGLAYIQQAKKVLHEAKKLSHLSDLSRGVPSGNFHLGVIPTLSPYMIPLFAGDFASKYPGVQLRISELKTDSIIEYLRDDKLDAGLLVTPLNQSQIIEKPLFREPFFVFASTNHPISECSEVIESELQGENLWLLEEGHCFRDQALNVCNARIGRSKVANLELTSGNLLTLVKLVHRYSGYTLLPEMATYDLKDEEKLHLRPFKEPIPTREISLVHSSNLIKKLIFSVLEREIRATIPPSLSKEPSPERIPNEKLCVDRAEEFNNTQDFKTRIIPIR